MEADLEEGAELVVQAATPPYAAKSPEWFLEPAKPVGVVELCSKKALCKLHCCL